MRPFLNRGKVFIALILAFAIFSTVLSSCTPSAVDDSLSPMSATPIQNQPSPVATNTPAVNLTRQAMDFRSTFGITISAKSLCSDAANTTLTIKTDLDARLWHLTETSFFPKGKTYFETSILFLENDKLFSSSSSGKRDDPTFDLQNYTISTVQRFVFPKTASPGSKYTVKAKVSLLDLPAGYSPPVSLVFLEPGIIEIPMEYVIPANLGLCLR